jgi:hypothetical protein
MRNVTAAMRVHPVGIAVPAVILTGAAVCYVLIASVTVRGRPQAHALGQTATHFEVTPAPGQIPTIGEERVPGPREQPSGRVPPPAESAGTQAASQPGQRLGGSTAPSSAVPTPGPPGSSSPPSPVPPDPSPSSAPTPTSPGGGGSPGGSGLCLGLGLLRLCVGR